MRQVVVTEPGTLIFQQVEAPQELEAKEVLLNIKTIGICGSDIHVFQGEHPAVIYPVVQGHEYAGQIVKVGADPVVNKFHLGEHELQLKGSLMYLHEDYLEAARLIAEGSIVLEPLVTKRFRFEEFNDAYLHIQNERDTTLKVLINL